VATIGRGVRNRGVPAGTFATPALHGILLPPVDIPQDLNVLLQGNTEYLREIKALFEAGGVKAWTGPLPDTGWGTKAWLAVARPDTQRAMQLYEAHLDAMVDNSGLPRVESTVDLDAEEATCPACQTPFKTADAERCPECGLRFA
jgi:hypothetical protein